MKNTRPVSWIKAASKDFGEFPEHVQRDMLNALTIAAEGGNLTTPNRSWELTAACLKSHFGIVGMPFVSFTP
jgi:phage-related protein